MINIFWFLHGRTAEVIELYVFFCIAGIAGFGGRNTLAARHSSRTFNFVVYRVIVRRGLNPLNPQTYNRSWLKNFCIFYV